MTEQELSKVPFHLVGHAAWEHEHTLTYSSKDGRLGFCVHTPKGRGKPYRHWRIDNKIFKSKEKFLEALKDFNPEENEQHKAD